MIKHTGLHNTIIIGFIIVLFSIAGIAIWWFSKGRQEYDLNALSKDNFSNYVIQVSENIKKSAQEFLLTHADLVDRLTAAPVIQGATADTLETTSANIEQLIKHYNLTNLGHDSIEFVLPSTKDSATPFIIRFALPMHYRENINAALGKPRGSAITHEEYEEFVQKFGTNFYQNVSRYPTWLRYKQAIADHSLFMLEAPLLYLVHISGRPKEISDANYVIVRQLFPNAQSLADTATLAKVSDEAIKQLCIAIVETGLWGVSGGKNIIMTDDNHLIWLEFQQPDTTSPAEFTKTPGWRHAHNALAGLESLYKLLQQGSRMTTAGQVAAFAQEYLNRMAQDKTVAAQLGVSFKQKSLEDKKKRLSLFFAEFK